LPELLLLLMNEIPPLHFACATWFPDRSTTIQYLSMVVPNDCIQLHEGKLPFHNLCLARAPHCFLEWWLEKYPNAIHMPTTDTGDFPLHCYLSSHKSTHTTSSGNITTKREYFTKTRQTAATYSSTIQYLAKQYLTAMCSTNRQGWLPLHMLVFARCTIRRVVLLGTRNSRVCDATG